MENSLENLNIIPKKENENNKEYAYRLLRHNIMTFHLFPGMHIQENIICQILNISRTPVHEAITLLKNENLIEVVPQSHSKVSLISLSKMREGLFLRLHLEPYIYTELCGTITPKYLSQMKDILDETQNLLDTTLDIDSDDFFLLDNEFHRLAYEASNKKTLWFANTLVSSHYDRVRHQGTVIKAQDLSYIHSQHYKLYEYLLIGNPTLLDMEAYYQNHLYYFKTYFPTLLKNYPQYFTD